MKNIKNKSKNKKTRNLLEFLLKGYYSLLVFSVRHTKELLEKRKRGKREKGETTIPLIKSGPKRFLIK